MITKITGRLTALGEDSATLAIEAFEYEVAIPDFTRRQLQMKVGEVVQLHTIYYMEGAMGQGRVTPRLVGFLSEVEREFFDLFCSVDGVGAKKALRAMVRPVKDIAVMIEDQSAKALSTLPGIGPATAERMIAKLRRKMSKFALMVVRDEVGSTDMPRDLVEESFHALCALGHSEADARKMLDRLLHSKKKFTDIESILHAIYQDMHGSAE